MKRIIFAEWHKIKTYKTFWAILALFLIFLPIIFLGISYFIGIFIKGNEEIVAQYGFSSTTPYFFPGVWHNLAFLGSYFQLILGLIMIILVTNEFSFNTFKQNIIDGYERSDALFGKVFIGFAISLFAMIVVIITGLIFGFIYTPVVNTTDIFSGVGYLGNFFIQLLGYLGLALLIGVLFRRAGLAIVLFLLFCLIIEPALSFIAPPAYRDFFPVRALSSLVPPPFPSNLELEQVAGQPDSTAILAGLAYTILFYFLSWLLIRKSDFSE